MGVGRVCAARTQRSPAKAKANSGISRKTRAIAAGASGKGSATALSYRLGDWGPSAKARRAGGESYNWGEVPRCRAVG